MRRPVAVAITGGIGAGKSEALQAFARLGAATVSSDEIVHHLLRNDEDVKRAIVERLGDGVLNDGGEIDRGRVAKRVFEDRGQLAWLEALLHPLVSREYLTWREQLGRLDSPPEVSVTEVPLLFEAGSQDNFDAVVVITAPEAVRRRRTKVPLEQRSGRLIDDEEKVRRADYSYVNDGSKRKLEAFVSSVLDDLRAKP
ncbi:MAG TPA: dephospho-CoA kinase [Gaiellaceae bacterium]|nr:dephospho-CoA kinase [Gaiellaceae bacterium]